jgi:hypothetical protein
MGGMGRRKKRPNEFYPRADHAYQERNEETKKGGELRMDLRRQIPLASFLHFSSGLFIHSLTDAKHLPTLAMIIDGLL